MRYLPQFFVIYMTVMSLLMILLPRPLIVLHEKMLGFLASHGAPRRGPAQGQLKLLSSMLKALKRNNCALSRLLGVLFLGLSWLLFLSFSK